MRGLQKFISHAPFTKKLQKKIYKRENYENRSFKNDKKEKEFPQKTGRKIPKVSVTHLAEIATTPVGRV